MDSIGTNTMTASYSVKTARAGQGGGAMGATVEVYTKSADDRDDLFRRIEMLERQVAEMQKAARISTINYFVPHPMKPEEIFDSLASNVSVYASRFRRTTQVAVFGSKGTPICAETLDPTPFETTEIKSFDDLKKVFSRFLDLNKISYEDWKRSR